MFQRLTHKTTHNVLELLKAKLLSEEGGGKWKLHETGKVGTLPHSDNYFFRKFNVKRLNSPEKKEASEERNETE